MTYFDRLEPAECLRLLQASGIGRVVWQGPDGLAVLPVNYQIIDEAVVFHTSPESSLAALATPTNVAFQVDEIDQESAIGWSVLAQGQSGPSAEQRCVSYIPKSPAVGVAIHIESVAGRVVSGNPA